MLIFKNAAKIIHFALIILKMVLVTPQGFKFVFFLYDSFMHFFFHDLLFFFQQQGSKTVREEKTKVNEKNEKNNKKGGCSLCPLVPFFLF